MQDLLWFGFISLGFALFCCLVTREGQEGRGSPGESGMSQAISLYSAEKSCRDLVLLEKNSESL